MAAAGGGAAAARRQVSEPLPLALLFRSLSSGGLHAWFDQVGRPHPPSPAQHGTSHPCRFHHGYACKGLDLQGRKVHMQTPDGQQLSVR